MNKYYIPHKIISVCIMISGMAVFLTGSSFSLKKTVQPVETGILKMVFLNTANGKPVVLRDSIYNNYFGEQYRINKLKYYISNILLTGKNVHNKMGIYYLVNAANDENAIELILPEGKYYNLTFLLGVDSIKNCSGAQTDALDPMNDMFWTWNTGYVMFKLEGTSDASNADLQRIEHHVGGYKGDHNVVTKIDFTFMDSPWIEIKKNKVTEILIEMNLDNYWHGNSEIKISQLPVCTTIGMLAKNVSANFKNLFSIKTISTLP